MNIFETNEHGNKKEYVRPELLLVTLALKEVILSSVEDLPPYIDDPGDWGDPIFDDGGGWLP